MNLKGKPILSDAQKIRQLADTAWELGLKEKSTSLHNEARELERTKNAEED